jgi:hypothetical protein
MVAAYLSVFRVEYYAKKEKGMKQAAREAYTSILKLKALLVCTPEMLTFNRLHSFSYHMMEL